MKKETILLVMYFLAVLIATIYLTWILTVIFAFGLGYFLKANKFKTFTLSFLIPFIIWIAIAFIRNAEYVKSISTMVSDLLGGFGESMVFIITGLSIGLVCGFGALTGQSLHHFVTTKKN